MYIKAVLIALAWFAAAFLVIAIGVAIAIFLNSLFIPQGGYNG